MAGAELDIARSIGGTFSPAQLEDAARSGAAGFLIGTHASGFGMGAALRRIRLRRSRLDGKRKPTDPPFASPQEARSLGRPAGARRQYPGVVAAFSANLNPDRTGPSRFVKTMSRCAMSATSTPCASETRNQHPRRSRLRRIPARNNLCGCDPRAGASSGCASPFGGGPSDASPTNSTTSAKTRAKHATSPTIRSASHVSKS